jgi:hypothetical protein
MSAKQYRVDQLVSAAKMGAAQELFGETGLHVRSQLDRNKLRYCSI